MSVPERVVVIATERSSHRNISCVAKLWRAEDGSLGIRIDRSTTTGEPTAVIIEKAASLAELDRMLLFQITCNPRRPPCPSVLSVAAKVLDIACCPTAA